MRERELKRPWSHNVVKRRPSLPMRERELKLIVRGRGLRRAWSLPMRERELKRPRRGPKGPAKGRSPCGSVN